MKNDYFSTDETVKRGNHCYNCCNYSKEKKLGFDELGEINSVGQQPVKMITLPCKHKLAIGYLKNISLFAF